MGSPLTTFVRAIALDPLLVDDFIADPERLLDRYGISEPHRSLLESKNDVAILLAVLKERDAAPHSDEIEG